MTKERMEHISIILEVIGFFVAAVDLIGRERIHHIEEWMKNKIEYLKTAKSSSVSTVFVYIFLAVVSYKASQMFASYFQDIPLTLGCILIMILIARYGTQFLAGAFFKILLHLTFGMGKLLKIFPFEGVLLGLGAVLFFIAKCMAYYGVESEWNF